MFVIYLHSYTVFETLLVMVFVPMQCLLTPVYFSSNKYIVKITIIGLGLKSLKFYYPKVHSTEKLNVCVSNRNMYWFHNYVVYVAFLSYLWREDQFVFFLYFSRHEEHEDMPQPSLNEWIFFLISREHWNKMPAIYMYCHYWDWNRRASRSTVISPSLQCVVIKETCYAYAANLKYLLSCISHLEMSCQGHRSAVR